MQSDTIDDLSQSLANKAIVWCGSITSAAQKTIDISKARRVLVAVFRNSSFSTPYLAFVDQWGGVSVASNGGNIIVRSSNNMLTIESNYTANYIVIGGHYN